MVGFATRERPYVDDRVGANTRWRDALSAKTTHCAPNETSKQRKLGAVCGRLDDF
jgi:hypothetical protein